MGDSAKMNVWLHKQVLRKLAENGVATGIHYPVPVHLQPAYAHLGGKPMILIQNTGLMESGDSIRGWLMGMEVPVVLMVGLRGWTRHGVTTDTAATYTERFLNAFNINYYLVESDADASRIDVAFKEAEKTRRPVAVLVGDEYHGFVAK